MSQSRSGDEPDIAFVPPATSSSKYNRVRVKVRLFLVKQCSSDFILMTFQLEESDNNSLLLSSAPSFDAIPSASAPPVKPTPKKRPNRKKAATIADTDGNGVVVKQENDPPAAAPKRGKKRKDRDDEAPYIDRSERNHKAKEKREAKAKAIVSKSSAPSSTPASSLSSILTSPGASTSAPATPSLKIRLPRMNAIGTPIKPAASASSARS